MYKYESESVCHLVVSHSLWTPWTVARQDSLSIGILQARIMKWLAIPFSRESSQPRDQTWVPCITADSLLSKPTGKPHIEWNKGQISFIFMWIQFYWHNLLKKWIFPILCSWHFTVDYLTVTVWIYFWALDSVPLVFVFRSVPYCFNYYTYYYNLKSGTVMPPALFFFLRLLWLIWPSNPSAGHIHRGNQNWESYVPQCSSQHCLQ